MTRPVNAESIRARARRLWDTPTLQRKWVRAVGLVRRTERGWLLDNPRGARHV